MNPSLIKFLAGAVSIGLLFTGFHFAKEHYIAVGVKKEQNRVALVAVTAALNQAQGKANALTDGAQRSTALNDAEKKLGGALNSSEVLNHAEIDSPCLSLARRLRINSIR